MITLQMVHMTGKPPSPLPKAFNHATSEFSTCSTDFNETAWGNQTQGFIKLINKQLRPGSYNKIVMGAWDITKKSHSVVCTKEVIDLMGDEPPDEFAMLINVPSDDDGLEDRKIPIIKNHHVEHKTGPNIISNTKQVENTWQTLDGMSHMETGVYMGTWTILVFLRMRMMGKSWIIF